MDAHIDTSRPAPSQATPFDWSLLLPLALAQYSNPLPFPDRDYQVFSTSSAEALVAMEDVMQSLGQRPR